MKETFEAMIDELRLRKIPFARRIMGRFRGSLCPEIQYIRIDALEAEDVPGGIDLNSVYIDFEIDLGKGKIGVHGCGHVWLSESDKTTEKYRYCCMKSAEDVLRDAGGKRFRKQGFRDVPDACDKMAKYFEAVMEAVDGYTGGYPYKKGRD